MRFHGSRGLKPTLQVACLTRWLPRLPSNELSMHRKTTIRGGLLADLDILRVAIRNSSQWESPMIRIACAIVLVGLVVAGGPDVASGLAEPAPAVRGPEASKVAALNDIA